MARRLRVFIGCSAELKTAAEQFRLKLSQYYDVHPWWEAPEFTNLSSTLDGLLKATGRYHAAAFVLSPDDLTKSRGKLERSFRDNVLFELGLFLGALGREAIYSCTVDPVYLPPAGGTSTEIDMSGVTAEMHIPSDLKGIHIPSSQVSTKDGLAAAMGRAAAECNDKFQKVLPIERLSGLLRGVSHHPKENRFTLTIRGSAVDQHKDQINDRRLLGVAVLLNDNESLESICDIALSELWRPPEFPSGEDKRIAIADHPLLGKIRPGMGIELVLLLSPPSLDPLKHKNLNSLFDAGCFFVAGKGIPAKRYPKKKP
jgi:hypothetical protein